MYRSNLNRARGRRLFGAVASTVLCTLSFGTAAATAAPPSGDADIAVSVTTSAPAVKVGGAVTLTAKVENRGPDAATGTVITYRFPNSVMLNSADSSVGNCVLKGQRVDCTVGDLAINATAEATFEIKVTLAGLVTHTISASADQRDPVRSNDSASVQVNGLGTPVPTCGGKSATVLGTPAADTLTGTAKRDVIVGLGGNDTIYGLGGNDIVCAGSGNDIVNGGADADKLLGGGGNDRLIGAGGGDLLAGQVGRDVLKGKAGRDVLKGGSGFDRGFGGAGLDVIRTCEVKRQ